MKLSRTAFFYLGYVPSVNSESLSWWKGHLSNFWSSEEPPETSFASAKRCIGEGMQRILRFTDSNCHVVPLSGGLDSRLILAELVDHVSRDNLVAINFGQTSTYDYELPKRVCENLDIQLIQFELQDLLEEVLDEKKFLEAAQSFDKPFIMVRALINHHVQEQLSDDAVIWSGYLGDPLTGSHSSGTDETNWQQAVERFIHDAQYSRLGNNVDVEEFKNSFLPDESFFPGELLDFERQLDFFIRQAGFIRKVVASPKRTVVYPFLTPQWVEFCMQLSKEDLKDQSFYKTFLTEHYPAFFSIGVKNRMGLSLDSSYWKKWIRQRKISLQKRIPIWGVDPMENYLDFGEYFTQSEEKRDLAWSFLSEVEEQVSLESVAYSPGEVMERCVAGEDWGDELTQYISLGSFLKAPC